MSYRTPRSHTALPHYDRTTPESQRDARTGAHDLPLTLRRFGTNTFPEPDVKSFWELCQEALEDPTMVILCVAAAVSLLIGVVKGWPNPMSECYEGLAIVMAVSPFNHSCALLLRASSVLRRCSSCEAK